MADFLNGNKIFNTFKEQVSIYLNSYSKLTSLWLLPYKLKVIYTLLEKNMFKFFAKKSITLISIFSLFINIISPLALAGQIYAQEASPAPVVEEAPAPSANPGESPVPTTNENTPAEASPAPEV